MSAHGGVELRGATGERARAASRAGAGRLLRDVLRAVVPPLLFLALLAAGWQLLASSSDSSLVPDLSDVAQSLRDVLGSSGGLSDLAVTVERVVLGFALAFVVAVAAGIAMGRNRWIAAFLEPAVLLGLTIPGLVWALLCVIWFGVALTTPVVAIALSAAPALVLNVVQGVRSVDPAVLEMAHVFRFGRADAAAQAVAAGACAVPAERRAARPLTLLEGDRAGRDVRHVERRRLSAQPGVQRAGRRARARLDAVVRRRDGGARVRAAAHDRTARHALAAGGDRMSAPIVVQDVSKTFARARGGARREVLSDFSLRVEPGELVALVGPSGCGKTTILNLVAGLERADSGTVMLGTSAGADDDARRARGERAGSAPRSGWSSSSRGCWSGSPRTRTCCWPRARPGSPTAASTSCSPPSACPTTATPTPRRCRAASASGSRSRARFVIDPDVVLLDEPFSALDELTARRLRLLLQELWLGGRRTGLLVSHNPLEAALLADRVIVLGAEPARIVREHAVDVERPRHPEDERLYQLHREIIGALVRWRAPPSATGACCGRWRWRPVCR